MARPTDPEKLAALRARQAEASKRYRARSRSIAEGVGVPVAVQRRTQPRAQPGNQRIVERAVEAAAALRTGRAAFLAQLPNVMNPLANIRPPAEWKRGLPNLKMKSVSGQLNAARRIRDNENAKRINNLGRNQSRNVRNELESGPQSQRLNENLATDANKARFLAATDKISSISQQALGILFFHTGGRDLYFSALESILGSPESRDVEGGLQRLEMLADKAVEADRLYAPKAIGRVRF